MLLYVHVRSSLADPARRGALSARGARGQGPWDVRCGRHQGGDRPRAAGDPGRSGLRGPKDPRRGRHGRAGRPGGPSARIGRAARAARVIVLDTTVLVYAKGTDHPLRDPCRALIQAAQEGRLGLTTTAEAIQEFVHVRARRRDRTDAAELGRAYVDLLSPLLPIAEQDVREGLRLFERHQDLGAFDAVLAAAAMAAGAATLVSAGRAFAHVPGLTHMDPASQDLAGLLS